MTQNTSMKHKTTATPESNRSSVDEQADETGAAMLLLWVGKICCCLLNKIELSIFLHLWLLKYDILQSYNVNSNCRIVLHHLPSLLIPMKTFQYSASQISKPGMLAQHSRTEPLTPTKSKHNYCDWTFRRR